MTENGIIKMSTEELQRSEILRMAEEKQISQKEGPKRVGLRCDTLGG